MPSSVCKINPKTSRCGKSKKHTATPELCKTNSKGRCQKVSTKAKQTKAKEFKSIKNHGKRGFFEMTNGKFSIVEDPTVSTTLDKTSQN